MIGQKSRAPAHFTPKKADFTPQYNNIEPMKSFKIENSKRYEGSYNPLKISS